jgi:hypothetical protein
METKSYNDTSTANDGIGLLKIIKAVTHNVDDHICILDTIPTAKKHFFLFRQSAKMSNATCYQKFLDQVRILEYLRASV